MSAGNNTNPPKRSRWRRRTTVRRGRLVARLRTYLLTGLVIAAPIGITVYITWWFVNLFDSWIKPLVPARYLPDTYLPVSVPGFGLVVALIGLTLLGALTANLFGRTIVAAGEHLLDRMPIVRNVYKALKQIFETVLSQTNTSFRQVGLIEYPRKGLYALVFISTETSGEVDKMAAPGESMLSVFLPTTPNPTSGFLLFVPRKDVTILKMTVEEGAKLVISAGLVGPKSDKTRGGEGDRAKRPPAVPVIDANTAETLPRPAEKESA